MTFILLTLGWCLVGFVLFLLISKLVDKAVYGKDVLEALTWCWLGGALIILLIIAVFVKLGNKWKTSEWSKKKLF